MAEAERAEVLRRVLNFMSEEYLFIGLDENVEMFFGGAVGNTQYVDHVLKGIAAMICCIVNQDEGKSIEEKMLNVKGLVDDLRDFAIEDLMELY